MRRSQVYRLRRTHFVHSASSSFQAALAVRLAASPAPRGSRGRHVPGARRSATTRGRSGQCAADDHRIRIDSDGAFDLHANGFAVLTGHVSGRPGPAQRLGGIASPTTTGHGQGRRSRARWISRIRGCGVPATPAAYDSLRRRRISTGPTFRSSIATAAASPRTWKCSRTARCALRRCATPAARSATRIGCLQASSIKLDTERAAGRRAPGRDALQGRAGFLHALHLVSPGRRAQERPAVPELWSFGQQRLSSWRCPTTSISRRTTT